MKQIISIDNNNSTAGDKLLGEWGEQHCCIAGWSAAQKNFTSLRYYTFSFLTTSVITEVIENIKQLSEVDSSIVLCSAFAEAVLVPARFYNKEESYIASLYGKKLQQEFSDSIEQWQVVNVYSLPAVLNEALQKDFSGVTYIHAFTTALKVYNGFIANDSISVHFTPYNFRISVKKGGNLLLVQMYPYQAPLDVVYYLLKITEEFSLPKEELFVVLSGLIEESSSLYQELQNYFKTVQFAATPQVANADYPAHYFTSMYNLSACVS